jgi:hypothetical protein
MKISFQWPNNEFRIETNFEDFVCLPNMSCLTCPSVCLSCLSVCHCVGRDYLVFKFCWAEIKKKCFLYIVVYFFQNWIHQKHLLRLKTNFSLIFNCLTAKLKYKIRNQNWLLNETIKTTNCILTSKNFSLIGFH